MQNRNEADTRLTMTRTILASMGATLLAFTLLILVGWGASSWGLFGSKRAIILRDVILVLLMDIPIAISWWLAKRGYWRLGSYVAPGVFFVLGLYGSFSDGLLTTSVLFYVLAILLTSVLQEGRAAWLTLLLSVGTYTVVGWNRGDVDVESKVPVAIMVCGTLLGITLLQWFSAGRVQRALGQAQASAARLRAEIAEREQAEEKIDSLARFPNENPTPVLRVSKEGTVLYANKAGAPLLACWECQVSQPMPDEWREFIAEVYDSGVNKGAEVECRGRILSLAFAPVLDAGYINIYGFDTTDRKQAEQALEDSERKFRSLVERTPDGVVLTDEQGTVIEWNQAMEQILGLKRTEVIGRPLWDVQFQSAVEEQRTQIGYERLKAMLIELYQTGQAPWLSRLTDTEIQRPDGTRRMVQALTFALSTDRGYRAGSILRDITERKQAEEEIRKLSQAVEQSPSTLVITDTQGNIEYVNPKFTQLTRYTAEEALGQNPRLLKSGEQPFAFYKELWDTIAQGKEWRGEFCNRKKDGELYWELASISPIRNPSGQITHFLKVGEDITERKKAEEALAWEAKVNSALAELSSALLSPASLEDVSNQVLEHAKRLTGSEFGFVGYIDPETGYFVAPTLTREIWDICQVEPKDIVSKQYGGLWGWVLEHRRPLLANTPADDPRSRGTPRGHIPIRRFLGVPALIGDRLAGQVAVANADRDYVERDQALVERMAALYAIALQRHWAEEALQQRTAELQASNEELDAFAHTVAHDLRNPLSLITGFAETLEEIHDTLPPEALRGHLHKIAQSGRKMDSIVDELLLLAGLRRVEMTMQPLDMAHIVAEARQRLIDMVEEQQAEIVAPAIWPVALGHGPWVEEVWVNYLSNAIRYGGRPPRVELGATTQADGMVRFWIRDNGLGLTLEERGRLFKPFTQLDRPHPEGHGLGLSIVRRIVEKLGGRVGVESEGVLGQGSVFSFTLPAAAKEE